jgi:regulator of cell morphogenesis and NO signaling
MKLDPATPIREMALSVPGATAVFDRVGLDYCCAGSASLASACDRAGLRLEIVIESLDQASQTAANVASFHDWRAERPAAVAAHIVDHNYPVERETMADTTALIAKVASVHGAQHAELREIEAIWAELCRQLRRHLHDEGAALEPLKDPDSVRNQRTAAPKSAFAGQHEEVVGLVRKIRELTRGYAPPGDACDALEALYRDLEAFEADLHEHVLLADNVLFVDRLQRA